jgi:hypothetical protein
MMSRILMAATFSLFFVAVAQKCSNTFQLRQRDPATVDWNDRRPIGSIYLARDNTKWRSNPRGWFNDPKIDVFSPEGLRAFETRLMEYADRSVALLKAMNAQGMIAWDIEGQEFPHAEASYVGNPLLLFRIAPEMDLFADDFFRKFASQGLRTGICVRPQEIVFRPDGSFYQREFLFNTEAIFASLDQKIRYAKKRWNCSLFYVDSNFGALNLGLYDVVIFKKLHEKYPDVLLIPEHENRRYFAYTAPYYDLKGGEKWPGTRSLSIENTSFCPKAFSVINTADGNVNGRRSELLDAVKRGNILLYRTWWRSPEFDAVSSIYKEAPETLSFLSGPSI